VNRYWFFATDCRLRASSRDLGARIGSSALRLASRPSRIFFASFAVKAFVKNQILNRNVR
jgi:hypothetical protein